MSWFNLGVKGATKAKAAISARAAACSCREAKAKRESLSKPPHFWFYDKDDPSGSIGWYHVIAPTWKDAERALMRRFRVMRKARGVDPGSGWRRSTFTKWRAENTAYGTPAKVLRA